MKSCSFSEAVNPQRAETFVLSVTMPENCEQLRADGNIPAGPEHRPRPSRAIPSTHPLSQRPWEARRRAHLAAWVSRRKSCRHVWRSRHVANQVRRIKRWSDGRRRGLTPIQHSPVTFDPQTLSVCPRPLWKTPYLLDEPLRQRTWVIRRPFFPPSTV